MVSQFTCYSTGCGKKTSIDVKNAAATPGFTIECGHCSKEWAVSFKGRTCCSLMLMFVSIEKEGKQSIKKIQNFKVK